MAEGGFDDIEMEDIDDFSKYYALDNEGLNGVYNQVQQRRNTLLTTSDMTDVVTKVERELKYVNRLREGRNFPKTTFIDRNGGKTVTIEKRGVNTEITAGRFVNQDNTEPGDAPPPPRQCATASFKSSSTYLKMRRSNISCNWAGHTTTD